MTRVTFETATIADAIRSAEKVAPSKGQAFDKAAGILIEVDPSTETVLVRATDTEIFHMAWIDCTEIEGDATSWLLPSKMFGSFMGALPIGSNKTVTMYDKVVGHSRALYVEQGRTKAKFMLMGNEYYPVWGAFDPDGLFQAKDLGGRISQVEWAASKNPSEVPLNGVHLDGEWAICTDRYRCARVPLPIPDLAQPITVPAGLIGGLLKQTGEVQIGTDGNTLLVMPDEHTQIKTVIFDKKYPNAKRIMREDHSAKVKFSKDELLEVLTRVSPATGSERTPTLRMFLGNEEIAVMMSDVERGMIGDVVEVPGQATHDRIEIRVTPKNVLDTLNNCPNKEVTLGYEPSRPSDIIHFSDGAGYDAWVMPRREKGEASG